MSRGLSQQQRRILGFGYALNRALHGGSFRQHRVEAAGAYNKPEYAHLLIAADDQMPADFTPAMLPYFIGGVDVQPSWLGWSRNNYQNTGSFKSIRVSLSRATSTLHHHEYLAEHRARRGVSPHWGRYGYVLTPKGAALGGDYADEWPDVLIRAVVLFGRWLDWPRLRGYAAQFAVAIPADAALRSRELRADVLERYRRGGGSDSVDSVSVSDVGKPTLLTVTEGARRNVDNRYKDLRSGIFATLNRGEVIEGEFSEGAP